ncbi:hypothetical protein CEXT_416621 [Caerostris extrusa]|uniref:Uncharacterized protein n=1 Tax=Caerostris extrusa TaxID=172846 RepID=A0AAV4N940_CAEEX|nr:hypothetical protein CEXT_416621 [Caerostris extrusa]
MAQGPSSHAAVTFNRVISLQEVKPIAKMHFSITRTDAFPSPRNNNNGSRSEADHENAFSIAGTDAFNIPPNNNNGSSRSEADRENEFSITRTDAFPSPRNNSNGSSNRRTSAPYALRRSLTKQGLKNAVKS